MNEILYIKWLLELFGGWKWWDYGQFNFFYPDVYFPQRLYISFMTGDEEKAGKKWRLTFNHSYQTAKKNFEKRGIKLEVLLE